MEDIGKMKKIKNWLIKKVKSEKFVKGTSFLTKLLLFIPVMFIVILASWYIAYTLIFFKPLGNELGVNETIRK